MADVSILAGATSQSILVDLYILATGAPQTALVYNSTSLTAYYSFAGASATATAITLATLATPTTAWSSGGFIKLDDTNMPGAYRFDIPNAAIASAKGREVIVTFTGFSGMATRHIKIELTGWDNQDAVHGGLSALPNTACTTNASLLTSGTGTDQISVSAGKVLLQATQSGVTIPTVTTVGTLTTYTGNTPQTGDSYAVVNSATFGNAKLVRSTTPANTLDVSATGEAGIDWANVGSPTTSLNLSGTTISTGQTIATVTNQLTAAQVATGVWQDSTAGDFTAASSIGKSLYTSGVVPGGTNGLFIAGTNAATTVTTAFTTTFTGNLTGSVSGAVGSVTGAVGSVIGGVGGSVSGNVVGSVGSIFGVSFPSGFSTLTTAAIATATWTDTTGSDFTTTSSPGKILVTQLGGTFTTTSSSIFSTASLANAPTGGSAPTTAQIATAVWEDLLAGGDFGTVGSIGKLLATDIDATISSRSTYSGGAVASVTTPVTVGTNNDKTGYSLTQVFPTNFAALGISVAGKINEVVLTDTATTLTNLPTAPTDWVTSASVSTGAVTKIQSGLATPTNITAGTITTVTNLTNAPTAGDFTSTMKTSLNAATPASVVGAVGSVTGNVGGNVVGSVGSISGITFPTNFAALGISVGGKINEVILTDTATAVTNAVTVGNVTLAASQPNYAPAKAGDAMTLTTAYDLAKTAATQTSVNAIPTNPLTSLGTNAPVGWVNAASIGAGALNGKGDWLLAANYTAPLTTTQTAQAVLNAVASSYDTAGSIGSAINAGGASGDPWSTVLPGSYSAGEAGYLLGTFLDAAVSSRALASGVILTSAGLDAVVVETGLNARQALNLCLAESAGKLSGGGTTTATIKGAGTNTTRITATVDSLGNRSAIILNPPA
jgi:hypothetical protein